MEQPPMSAFNRALASAKNLPWSFPERHWVILFFAALLSVCAPWIFLTQPIPAIPERPSPQITSLRIAQSVEAGLLRERPLFNRRRSLGTAELAPAVNGSMDPNLNMPEPPAPVAPAPPELVGVATGKNRAIAIVKGSDGLARNLAPGQIVDGWKLTSVGRASASFRNGEFKQTIVLGFNNKQPLSANTAPAANQTEQIVAPNEEDN